ncbi:alpha/beta hydrolase [Corynebacterium sp. YIM 101645]|uniref:Alpha/beta hydrolase n=1 Tax=Corynebacterium lemuris TaxID=1859292 RepID=A0ABT2FSG3_9CORY|nr:alpha/beta hydrolase [Corynebacterium lemuris]MCS5478152.1 alpha/beta hydrolase [Corynebacterium lemuris]
MNLERRPILFIGGSGLSGWIWEDVRARLGAHPGDGVTARPATGTRASLRDYAAAALDSAPGGEFTVVAHSSGGVIAAELARRAPERVAALLAVSAVIPAPGRSFIETLPAPNRWLLGLVMSLTSTRPPASSIRRGLAYGLNEELAGRIISGFVPESRHLYRDRVGAGTWAGRCGYVLTTRDRELPFAVQRKSAQTLGAEWTREIATGHLPMLEDPRALTAAITDFLAEEDQTRR